MAADYAQRYEAELREPDSDTAFLDDALTDLPDGPVLDLGCGPAQVSGYLADRGRTAIGIDMAPGMLAAAARLGAALAGLRDVLKPGGVLIVITHGGSGEEWLDRPEGRVVFSRYSPAELAGRLRDCGLVPEVTSMRPPRTGEYPADKIRISARRG